MLKVSFQEDLQTLPLKLFFFASSLKIGFESKCFGADVHESWHDWVVLQNISLQFRVRVNFVQGPGRAYVVLLLVSTKWRATPNGTCKAPFKN